jgi:predicted ATPase
MVAEATHRTCAQGTVRKQSLEEAEATYHAMAGAYSRSGYALTSLPLTSVQDRVQVVLERIR